MKSQALTQKRRLRRRLSVRATIARTADRPRLSVHRTSKHIYAQVICDRTGKTLASASTSSKTFGSENAGKNKTERAKLVGAEVARRAKDAGVETVVFDRGAFRYHGRVKALADAAREGGLKF
ncbi:MAG: 50S ribosomal protein L18 [Planctomycetota bacterium]